MGVLVKLSPEKVGLHWPLIKTAILSSLPDADSEKLLVSDANLNAIHARILKGDMAVWFGPPTAIPLYVFVTSILRNAETKDYSLCIYAFFRVPDSVFVEGLIQPPEPTTEDRDEAASILFDYAKSIGCARIWLQTENVRVRQLCLKYGFKEQFCFTLPIGKE